MNGAFPSFREPGAHLEERRFARVRAIQAKMKPQQAQAYLDTITAEVERIEARHQAKGQK